ncbi:MAG TPA: D-aminoacyl-tRNA deacylase [Balneolales bacterium]|nr:D-aminoacyl-tRNA deacylase [Balneolales bacterium]HYX07152.1 D-aminoacyl-tRNA deacylase [Bacteroidales bacterium]
MKVIVQRVSEASVSVEGNITGKIGNGLLLLVGIHPDDTQKELEWICRKIVKLRIFEDENNKMNLSVDDVNGGLLVVSQFTLYGNVNKGTRPSFIEAAKPDKAEPMYNDMIDYFKKNTSLEVQTGIFGAMMDVSLVNEGPVTIILEK